jgi:hypothetical protein
MISLSRIPKLTHKPSVALVSSVLRQRIRLCGNEFGWPVPDFASIHSFKCRVYHLGDEANEANEANSDLSANAGAARLAEVLMIKDMK